MLTPGLDHLDPTFHGYDLLAPEAFVGTRAYPTELDLRLLADSYGYRVVIPPSQGYGDQGNSQIPADSTLFFVIDILGVI